MTVLLGWNLSNWDCTDLLMETGNILFHVGHFQQLPSIFQKIVQFFRGQVGKLETLWCFYCCFFISHRTWVCIFPQVFAFFFLWAFLSTSHVSAMSLMESNINLMATVTYICCLKSFVPSWAWPQMFDYSWKPMASFDNVWALNMKLVFITCCQKV